MELEIVKFFNLLGSKRIDKMIDFASRLRYLVYFWVSVMLTFLILDRTNGQKIFFAIILAFILHFIVTEGIIKFLLSKIWGKRLRPYIRSREIIPIGRKFTSSSFPSSHMATTLIPLTVIFYFYPIIWPLALIIVLFMAYARMHQGMHYLSDVIVGIVIGILYGLLGLLMLDKF